jgi:hypothetical protein
MDRNDWDCIVGCDNTLIQDLEWKLFQANRSINTMEEERDNFGYDFVSDEEVYDSNIRMRDDARIALAALYTRVQP